LNRQPLSLYRSYDLIKKELLTMSRKASYEDQSFYRSKKSACFTRLIILQAETHDA